MEHRRRTKTQGDRGLICRRCKRKFRSDHSLAIHSTSCRPVFPRVKFSALLREHDTNLKVLAKRSGYATQTVEAVCRGVRDPGPPLLACLLQALQVPVADWRPWWPWLPTSARELVCRVGRAGCGKTFQSRWLTSREADTKLHLRSDGRWEGLLCPDCRPSLKSPKALRVLRRGLEKIDREAIRTHVRPQPSESQAEKIRTKKPDLLNWARGERIKALRVKALKDYETDEGELERRRLKKIKAAASSGWTSYRIWQGTILKRPLRFGRCALCGRVMSRGAWRRKGEVDKIPSRFHEPCRSAWRTYWREMGKYPPKVPLGVVIDEKSKPGPKPEATLDRNFWLWVGTSLAIPHQRLLKMARKLFPKAPIDKRDVKKTVRALIRLLPGDPRLIFPPTRRAAHAYTETRRNRSTWRPATMRPSASHLVRAACGPGEISLEPLLRELIASRARNDLIKKLRHYTMPIAQIVRVTGAPEEYVKQVLGPEVTIDRVQQAVAQRDGIDLLELTRSHPGRGTANPIDEATRAQIIEYRNQGLGVMEIEDKLWESGKRVHWGSISRVLHEEGFQRLPRRVGRADTDAKTQLAEVHAAERRRVHDRHVAMYLAVELTHETEAAIGRAFGFEKNKGAVSRAHKRIEARLEHDAALRQEINELRASLVARRNGAA